MTITTISYSQSKETVYSFGLKKWNKVGIDIAIDEKDDTQKVFEFAKETVENWLKEDVQQPVAQMDEPVVQVDNPKEPKLTKEERQKKALTDCTTIDGDDGLKSFALLVSKNSHLQETYDNHFKKLQNGLQ